MKRLLPFAALALVACSNDLAPSDSGYSAGVLGNGGFAFTCDDSVVCGKYNAADTFPDDGVARGSSFQMRFIPRTSNQADAVGVTIGTVGTDYLTVVANVLYAQAEGMGTVVARDSNGAIVDYKTIAIHAPTSIVLYEVDATTTNPLPLDAIDLSLNDSPRKFHAVSRWKDKDLAGTVQYEFTVGDGTVLTVSGAESGAVTLRGEKAGTTTLTATGATFSKVITVTVK